MFLSFDRGFLLLVSLSTKSVYTSIRKVHYMGSTELWQNMGIVTERT